MLFELLEQPVPAQMEMLRQKGLPNLPGGPSDPLVVELKAGDIVLQAAELPEIRYELPQTL